MKNTIIAALTALVFGFAGAGLWQFGGFADRATRAYLLENPEVLQEMAEAFQSKQSAERLADVNADVTAPFPGAVLGNPNGSRTLVKFTDYGCTYCRQSIADIDRLVKEDPDLRVVVREWPIFQGSEGAARWGLAAARQGKYARFYHAMFELGPPSDEAVAEAARAAGLDIEAARTFAESEEATVELARNMALARQLGFTGTPSWVAGGKILEGAVGYDRLAEALEGEATS